MQNTHCYCIIDLLLETIVSMEARRITMNISPSVVENIAKHAASKPDKLALADSKQALTYDQLWRCIYGLSQKFKEIGVGFEKCAVVECNQSVDYMVWPSSCLAPSSFLWKRMLPALVRSKSQPIQRLFFM